MLFQVRLLVLFFSTFCLFGCTGDPEPAEQKGRSGVNQEEIIQFHREMVMEENQEIENFCARYHWHMESSGTGLRYMVVSKGKGKPAGEGDTVLVAYELKLLTGEVIMNVGSENPDTAVIGRNSINRGIDEGLRLMNTGDRFRFIVPSHLGFGLLGDFGRIPFRATLVYDLTMLTHLKREK